MTEITSDQNLTEAINIPNLTIVDFWAEWCGPCRMIEPMLIQISTEYPDIQILKVNADDCPDITAKYQVRNIPALLFIKNSVVVDKIIGAVPVGLIRNKVLMWR